MPAVNDNKPRLLIRPLRRSDFAELRLQALVELRANGTVLNLKERRRDLYQATWAVLDHKV